MLCEVWFELDDLQDHPVVGFPGGDISYIPIDQSRTQSSCADGDGNPNINIGG